MGALIARALAGAGLSWLLTFFTGWAKTKADEKRGTEREQAKELQREIEAGKRIVEGQSDNSDSRADRVRDLKSGRRKL